MTSRTIHSYDPEDEEETIGPLRSLKPLTRRASQIALDSKEAAAALKEEIVYDYDIKTFVHEKPMREWRFLLPFSTKPVILNPVTTLVGMLPLWAMVIWCAAQPQEALDKLVALRGDIAHAWTWLVIVTKPLSLFFLFWITYKYGHIKFGGKDAMPEFGNLEYFAMVGLVWTEDCHIVTVATLTPWLVLLLDIYNWCRRWNVLLWCERTTLASKLALVRRGWV